MLLIEFIEPFEFEDSEKIEEEITEQEYEIFEEEEIEEEEPDGTDDYEEETERDISDDVKKSYLWRQNIGEDPFPVLDSTHHAVSLEDETYVNIHTYKNGFCTSCDSFMEAEAIADINDIDGDLDTEEIVYEISNAGQLYWFADMVNKQSDFIKANAFLAADITINEGVLNENNEPNNKDFREWTPIGLIPADPYAGVFDGAGYTVKGLYYGTESKYYVGFFGRTTGTVKNLNLTDSYIHASRNVGSICGSVENGYVINCHSYCVVIGDEYDGIICGRSIGSCFSDCSSEGCIRGSVIGGICGPCENSEFRNCTNSAQIEGYSSAGISGKIINCIIENCVNNGIIKGRNNSGGICGSVEEGRIVNSINNGNIEGDSNIGGICGLNKKTDVINCENHGMITCFGYNIGGICASDEDCLIERCTNTGNIIGSTFTGGISGKSNGSEKIRLCKNTGNVEGADRTGGIVGDLNRKIDTCSNSGEINGKSFTGGICGSGYNEILNCNNENHVSGSDNVGGIAGYSKSKIDTCSNSGEINGKSYIGGIVGFGIDETINCNNKNSVSGSNTVGGISGNSSGKIENCCNSGIINADNTVGGICGISSNEIINCINENTVKGSGYVGGVCGNKSSKSLKNSGNTGNVTGEGMYVGGLCGFSTCTISECFNEGAVNGWGEYNGGLVGYNINTIERCFNKGNIVSSKNAGGIACYNVGTIENSYNTGNFTASENAGGIALTNAGTIKNCFDTGESDSEAFSAIIVKNNSKIENCYYLDSVAEDANAEALSAEQFKSGEAACKLGPAFYQNIGEDVHPVLDSDHSVVYSSYPCHVYYSNNEFSEEQPHSVTVIPEIKAGCETEGCMAYRYCSGCNKYYSDEACENEITDLEKWLLNEGKTEALGHKLTKTEEVKASCEKDGAKAYYTCETCGKVYADEARENEITDLEKLLLNEGKTEAFGHKLAKTEEVKASCEKEGTKAFYTCETCGKIYADEACENEITDLEKWLLNEGKTAASGHNFVNGVCQNEGCKEVLQTEKTIRFAPPSGGYKYNMKYDIKTYDCENIIGVGITFRKAPADGASGAVVLGEYAASVSFGKADVSDRYFEFRFDQDSCWCKPDTLRIFDYNSYSPLGEIEEIVFIYNIEPEISTPSSNSVSITSENGTFSISEYCKTQKIESVTINFADYTYGGNGALVFGNWESSYSFNMSRENGTSVTISVDNITDTFKVYNWYNLSDVISVTLNFV